MRKKLLWLLPALLLLQAATTLAQHDTSLVLRINRLIELEPGLRLRADSAGRAGDVLQVYFNTPVSLEKGGLTETESEMLTELLAHLTTETNTQYIRLLAKDKLTASWKTLDYFVHQPPVLKYIPVKNHDPYPERGGKAVPVQGRVFPGSGIPGVSGALTGKTVWLSPGHGWHNTGTGFITQRGTTNQVVEDFTTAETVDYYLLHYLMNAGANVWSVRERDVNPIEIIVDNDQGAPGYTETGTWANGSIAGYNGTYRTNTADESESGSAIYTPVVTVSGYYWVSVRFISGANRATDVKYTILHAGGSATYTVNQEVHGDTWVYLGQYYFLAGGNHKVIISNQSTDAGQAVVADAVRLGGGVGGKLIV